LPHLRPQYFAARLVGGVGDQAPPFRMAHGGMVDPVRFGNRPAGSSRDSHKIGMSDVGLGRVKTQACCGAVEFDSHAPDVLASSREADITLPTGSISRSIAAILL